MEIGKRTRVVNFGMMAAMVTSSVEDEKEERVWERAALREIWRNLLEQKPFPAQAAATPGVFKAGERQKLTLQIKSSVEIPRGAHVTVLLPQFWGGICQERDGTTLFLRDSPHTYPGYLSSHISAAIEGGARIEGTVTCCGSVHTAIDLVIQDPVAPCQVISLVVGDPTGLGVLPIDFSGTYAFNLAVDVGGHGQYQPILPHPRVEVMAGPPTGYRVTAPVGGGAGNQLRLMLVDRSLNAVGQGETPHVEIHEEEGYRYAEVFHPTRGYRGRSNPWVQGAWAEGCHVYFGEIHAHSEMSDGIRTLDEAYDFSRATLGLDFAALSDHFESRLPSIVNPNRSRWEESVKAANRHQQIGQFATLVGYEWTGNPHINIYYRGEVGPCIPSDQEGCQTPRDLYRALDKHGLNYLAVPHHPKFLSQADWSKTQGKCQRLVEIYSGWGSSETGNEGSVAAAWATGEQLGVIAGTDCHIGRPGQGNRTVEGGGLACVLAGHLSREAIFDGLFSRRCYGTTGARVLLDFRVNGVMMGGQCREREVNEVRFRAIGEGSIALVEVFCNGEMISQHFPAQEACQKKVDHPGVGYYYLRLTQEDGHQAWSSPIWVTPKDVRHAF